MVRGSIRFGENVLDTDSLSLLPKLLGLVHRKHYHRRIWRNPRDLPCSLKPVHDGHCQIQDHHFGAEFFDFFNRNLAVLCLCAYLPARARLDELVARAEVVPKTRRPSRPTLGSKIRRLTAKSQRSSSKQLRGPANDE